MNKYISKRASGLDCYRAGPEIQGIALDKNETPRGMEDSMKEALIKRIREMKLNRYPDNDCKDLKKAISGYTALDLGSICIGNGSDELIHMALQAFTDPGDIMVIRKPTFSMYKVYGTMCGVKVLEYGPESDFELNIGGFVSLLRRERPKIVFLCNPNNPTGTIMELQDIEEVLKIVNGIVVVDEAYFEFSGTTAAGLLQNHENLIILRTFSKAMGLAALRVGYMLASPSLISCVERVRPPFNVNAFAQAAAAEVLANMNGVAERVEIIKSERRRLTKLLRELRGIQCFESRGNFILFRAEDAGEINKGLREAGIYVKSFSDPVLKDCLRVTIGSPTENNIFYEALKEVLYDKD